MREEPIRLTLLDNGDVWRALQPRLESLVLRGAFTMDEELRSFESSAAKAFGCPWAVGTASGTSALVLALRAALPARARVAVPANTFFADLEAVVVAGHVPVVVDHDGDYLCNAELLEGLELDAVLAVHLHGLPVDMVQLGTIAAERGWWVLEDASQAHGATIGSRPVGSFGDAAAFSAYPTKNLGAWGDAGFLTGSDPVLEDRVRALRHHGQRHPDTHDEVGGSERLDNLQALVLEEKLRRLDDVVSRRRQIADWYQEELGATGLILPGDRGERQHAYHHYVIRVEKRDGLRRHLASRGVETGVHYPTPVHMQPGASDRCLVVRTPERAEHWANQIVSLPMHPALRRDQIARVGAAIREFLGLETT